MARISDYQAGEIIRMSAMESVQDSGEFSLRSAPEYRLQHAIAEVYAEDAVRVNIKPKSLLKFGRTLQGNTTQLVTIMDLPAGTLNETYPAANTNSIDRISSSNAGDTQLVSIEGHTESGGVFIEKAHMTTSTGGPGASVFFDPVLIVKPNSDIRLRTLTGAANDEVIGSINGYLTKIES